MGLNATVSADMPTPELDWRQIFQAMPDGLIVIGLDFDVMFVNRAFAALSGVDEIQTIGRKCYDIFPGSLCHGPACPMARILAGIEQLVYEANKHCLCGRLIPSIVTAAPSVVGVDVGFRLESPVAIRDGMDVVQRATEIMVLHMRSAGRRVCDVLVEPDVGMFPGPILTTTWISSRPVSGPPRIGCPISGGR